MIKLFLIRVGSKQLLHNYRKCSSRPSTFSSIVSRKLSSETNDTETKINGINLSNYIKKLEEEYEELTAKTDAQQRLNSIKPVIAILEERRNLIESVSNLNELLHDESEDIRAMAKEEKTMFEKKLKIVEGNLEDALLNIDDEDYYNSIVLEVNAGVGGQEAMLFAGELFDMYSSFVEYKGWRSECAEYLSTDVGGIRHGSLLIDGENVYKYFKYEAGVHRVQRCPATEKSGRIHTSTASVLVLPQPTDIQIDIHGKDLRVETKRATGAGGQHVNTTDSAVRIVHLPSGIAVECQVDRSQRKNREIAMQRLKAKLYRDKLDRQLADIEATRKSQVRSNFRNEKIRTYNFGQDRITDHRLQSCNVHNIKGFFLGREDFENLTNKLHHNSKIENLLRIVSELENKD